MTTWKGTEQMKLQDSTKVDQNILKNMYKYILEASNDEFKYVNYKTGVVVTSTYCKDLFGVAKDEVFEEDIIPYIYDEDRDKFRKNMEFLKNSRDESFEFEFRVQNGNRWIHNTGALHYDQNGSLFEKFCLYKDITELKQKQLELEYMAYFDNETGVYNRNYFMKKLDMALNENDDNRKIQVIYLQIDNYNIINNSIGFQLGDQVIVRFAKMLSSYSSKILKVGRFNNDKFAIAFLDAKTDEDAINLCKEIRNKLQKPIKVGTSCEVFINVSAGISIYPTGGKIATDLIRSADIAMYNAKQSGKNGMFIFEESMLNKYMENITLEQKLKLAVENVCFTLNYQPQFYSGTKKIRGIEALIRWKLPTGESISPAVFIPLAEKNGAIINIGTWVIEQSLRDFSEMRTKYGYKGIMSINISAIQLREKNFKEVLLHYTEINHIEPEYIEIEITESVLIEDFNFTISILKELRDKGFKISLDDFGTGYSSLSYLKDIPINTLKIDKSFVDTMLIDQSTSIITNAVISMVKKLGLETIAEGVETEDQYEYLKQINCDNIQGYLLGKPMTKNSLIELIDREKSIMTEG